MAESFAPSFKSRLQVIINSIFTAISLSNSSLRVLCLQEINDEMLPLLLGQRFIQEEFPFSTHMPSSLLPSHRNLVILASRPFKNFSLQFSERHKTALIASFYEFPVEVANVHLTSALTNEAVVVKKSQLETLTKFFSHDRNTAGKEVIVAGDFNLTTSSRTIEVAVSRQIITPETARLVGSVIDPTIWEDTFNVLGQRPADYGQEIFEGEEGATFNRLSNALAAMTKSLVDYRPERYDRVLLRNGGRMYPEHFELFGVPDHRGHCASDHFGVCVRLRIDQADDADLNNSAVASSPRRMLPGAIEVIEDSTGLQPLLEPYLPTDADRKQREQALELLQATLTSNKSTADLVFATLGSYLMDTYFADSDVDMLIIGSVAQHVFFDFATAQLRALGTSEENGFKGVHFVNSLVSVVEVCVMGIKFDLQYCQAAELVQRYVLYFLQKGMSVLTPSKVPLHKPSTRSENTGIRQRTHVITITIFNPAPEHLPRHSLPPQHPSRSPLLPHISPIPLTVPQKPRTLLSKIWLPRRSPPFPHAEPRCETHRSRFQQSI
jgi:endonuclease/exonuclease/phosphatase family metal-dependent hydrolase